MEFRIVINGQHQQRLAAALESVQQKCAARTLGVGDIDHIIASVDSELRIPKKHIAGTKLYYSGAQKFPNAYRYQPMSTHVFAEHNGRHWVIKGIGRHSCPDRIDNITLVLSDSAKAALDKRFQSFRV